MLMANNNKLNKKACGSGNILMMILIGAVLYLLFRDRLEGMNDVFEGTGTIQGKMYTSKPDPELTDTKVSNWTTNNLKGKYVEGRLNTIDKAIGDIVEKVKVNKYFTDFNSFAIDDGLHDRETKLQEYRSNVRNNIRNPFDIPVKVPK